MSQHRPLAVWVIAIFYLLSMASTLVSLAAVLTGIVAITPEQQRYFDSLGPVDYLGNVLILLIGAWAVLELFLMRKAAVRAFVIALVMNVGLTAFHLLATNWREAAGGSGLATVIVSWIVSVGVLLYAKRLSNRGVLT
ncbi:MAG TPA: hypothetical protein VL243_08800 [Vicinamibacterales bacterium]|nr:hypothetical protein [Vicinamibacterales bacterium]